jgi:hypothetical protein
MAIGSLKDLYLDELADLYDAETQMIRALFRLAELARAPELRDALTKHHDESRLHLERLELMFTHGGERRRERSCAGLAGIVQEADKRLEQVSTDDARDAAIIGAAQRRGQYRKLPPTAALARPRAVSAVPTKPGCARRRSTRRPGGSTADRDRRSAHQRRRAEGDRRAAAACCTVDRPVG